MPELPEVETVKRGLEKLIKHKFIKKVSTDNPKSFPNSKNDVDAFIIGAQVTSVKRRAKLLIIDLSSDYTLLIHLKMTGQMVFVGSKKDRFGAGHPNDSLINELPDRSTRVTFLFEDGTNLYFNDQRKFGWVKLVPTAEVGNVPFISSLGPEPLEGKFSGNEFKERVLKRKNSTIKAVILDQKVLAGVGNIYADESLWMAKINPASRVKDIPQDKLIKLFDDIKDVLTLSINHGGATDRNYVNAEGKKGSYTNFAKVFRREGKPCERCGELIIKTRVASRGTHFCPVCQRLEE